MNAEQARFELPELATPRLRLRAFSLNDAPDMFEYASDPEVTRYVFWFPHESIQASIEFLNRHVQLAQNGEVTSWAMEHRADGKMIGTCGFVWWRPEHGKAEIAFAISRKYWNKGLTTEAVNACIRFGFETMQLNRIEARCMPDNVGSERVMQKCGMSCEGTFRQTMLVKGKYIDLKMYAILRQQYENYQKAAVLDAPVFRIEGKRVNLRTTMVKDLVDYKRWNHPGMPAWRFDGPWHGGNLDNLIKRRRQFLQSGMLPPYIFLEVETTDGVHIGWVNSNIRTDDPDATEFGIDFPDDTHWGRGLGTEALTRWIDHLFRERNLSRIGFTTWSGNPRMIALGEKLGFSHEGRIRNSCLVEGKFYDRLEMGLLREEWERTRNSVSGCGPATMNAAISRRSNGTGTDPKMLNDK
ncbi:MAG: GNAT family N-acetyltransferase [Candidatus Edwardsbacteria bacterium]|nr:GNAT family N-acetyltransferase [Candidatus Edwardsbacteria bacterium]